jgi:hypothetical protein
METLISGLASFAFFHLATRPKSKINKKLPRAKLKRFELFPRFNVEAKNKIFHFHHWMVLAPVYLFTQTIGKDFGILQSNILQGFLLGGIVQGLMYEDSFKFIHHNHEYQKKITSSSYHGFRFLRKLI